MQELVAKDIDASELDFSRYGETFFEVKANLRGYFLCIPARSV